MRHGPRCVASNISFWVQHLRCRFEVHEANSSVLRLVAWSQGEETQPIWEVWKCFNSCFAESIVFSTFSAFTWIPLQVYRITRHCPLAPCISQRARSQKSFQLLSVLQGQGLCQSSQNSSHVKTLPTLMAAGIDFLQRKVVRVSLKRCEVEVVKVFWGSSWHLNILFISDSVCCPYSNGCISLRVVSCSFLLKQPLAYAAKEHLLTTAVANYLDPSKFACPMSRSAAWERYAEKLQMPSHKTLQMTMGAQSSYQCSYPDWWRCKIFFPGEKKTKKGRKFCLHKVLFQLDNFPVSNLFQIRGKQRSTANLAQGTIWSFDEMLPLEVQYLKFKRRLHSGKGSLKLK